MIKLHAGNIKDIIGAAFTVAGHEMDEREATLGKNAARFRDIHRALFDLEETWPLV